MQVVATSSNLEQVHTQTMKLIHSDLYAIDPKVATELFERGYRPMEARNLQAGMAVVYFSTDVFGMGGVGAPCFATISEVSETEYGGIVVKHSGGITEADECSEVWAGVIG
jgi:hypothetical protein